MDESFQHHPVIPPRIVKDVPKIDEIWFERFAQFSSADVADHVGRLYTMESIVPLYHPIKRAVGRALTVKAWPGDGLSVHGAACFVEPGDILVVDARGYTGVSVAGDHMLAGPRFRGLRALVVDGAVRDVEDIQKSGLPVYGRARSTHASTKQRVGEINVSITCGGPIVEPGDLIIADGDGVVVVPRVHIELVWNELSTRGALGTDEASVAELDQKRLTNYLRVFGSVEGSEISWPEQVS